MALTTRQVQKIKQLYESGESVQTISQRLKIGSKTIYAHINKNNWDRKVVSHEIAKAEPGGNILESIRHSYLNKVQSLEGLSNMILNSLGSTPEELASISDDDMNRVLKQMKAVEMATKITDVNFQGVQKGFGHEQKNEDLQLLPINITVESTEEKKSQN
jgi:hypothetical protein